jgi:hypothetical protein
MYQTQTREYVFQHQCKWSDSQLVIQQEQRFFDHCTDICFLTTSNSWSAKSILLNILQLSFQTAFGIASFLENHKPYTQQLSFLGKTILLLSASSKIVL